jgi:hypothetical protein
MLTTPSQSRPRYYRWLFGFFVLVVSSAAFADSAADAVALAQQHLALEKNLLKSPFKRPLTLSSSESADQLGGELYAELQGGTETLANLSTTTINAQRWCEIILLLSNTKGCRVETVGGQPTLRVDISSSKTSGKTSSKNDRLTDGTETLFNLQVRAASPQFVDVALLAPQGPMGTHSIVLRVQAVPLSPTTLFVRLHYRYGTHWLGRLAMQGYLQTIGRGKVGFSPAPEDAPGNPTRNFIGGARAVIERNTLRYFLGVECAVQFAHLEAPQRFDAMAPCWFDAVEQYPLQLHEMPRSDYLALKAGTTNSP